MNEGDNMPIQNLSELQRAGQRLMVGFDGLSINDTLKQYIEQIKVGGLILFARNIDSPAQVQKLCAEAQACALDCGQPPLLIAIDQEGGVVSRLKPPFTQFDGNPHMKSADDAIRFALTTAQELGQIGVNMNMAPVLDVLPAHGPSVMQARAFGHDPKHVAHMGTTVIQHLQLEKIMAVAKHFPGIGRTVLDSHKDLPDLDVEAGLLADTDLIPFQAAIAADVAGMMLSHIRYRSLDPQWPASLSAQIADNLLRRRMAFDGLVITDDLDMGAIAKHYALPVIVQQCLNASVDILLICHPGPNIEAARNHILALRKDNEELIRKEEESLRRILGVKETYLAG
jgi:beta-N-acetylhexosaminidase